jgi:hypothetical protein
MVRRRGLLHHGRISSQGTPPKQNSGDGGGGVFLLVMVATPKGVTSILPLKNDQD